MKPIDGRNLKRLRRTVSTLSCQAQLPLSYEEPGVRTILVQVTFLLLLNTVNPVVDRLLYHGLVGQVLIGITWGAPGAQWLFLDSQHAVGSFGYIGLILIVFEGNYLAPDAVARAALKLIVQGGLSISFSALRADFLLCFGIALNEIALPMVFSHSLLKLSSAASLQAFAAGAALCSTSLGLRLPRD